MNFVTEDAVKLFFAKYASGTGTCKICNKNIWVFLSRGQPNMVGSDLTNHVCEKKSTHEPVKKIIEAERRSSGGEHHA